MCLCLCVIHLHADEEVSFPSEFTNKKGVTFHDCEIKRVEEDAIIIEHQGGMARVSLFDVSKELQKKYDFDPVAAMEKYKRDIETQRKLKWKRFLEGQKHEAAMARAESKEKFAEKVKATWIPVVATVHELKNGGAFVSASQIKYVPTKTKTTLGFEIDGPPRKTLVPMSPNVIFIKAAGIKLPKWQGYLEPLAHESIPHPLIKDDEIPSYRAVARTELQ